MADNDVNEVDAKLSRVALENDEVEDHEEEDDEDEDHEEEEEEEEEDAPELVREPSTPLVAKILNDLSGLSPDELREVKTAVDVMLKNHTRTPKHYVNWCTARDKWMGMPKPVKFARTKGALGDDVPTYQQWNGWNDPLYAKYIGDLWSVVDGKPVRKKK